MHLAILRLEVRIGDGLRVKRRTVRAIVARIHGHFNVSVAEVARSDHPSETVIGVAAVAATRREVREVLDRVLDAVAAHPRVEVIASELKEF